MTTKETIKKLIDFTMPSLGADMESGFLREWRVKAGDCVKRGDIIAEVETQKGLIEIEVFDEGTIESLLIAENEKVPVGTVMARIIPSVQTQAAAASTRTTSVEGGHRPRATPLARRLAEEYAIDLANIAGTGPDKAIIKEDVEAVISSRAKSEVGVKSGITTKGVRMAVAAAMSKSNREIPHYYLQTDVDMSGAMSWLHEANLQRSVKDRLLIVVLYLKCIAKALEEVPDFNGYWIDGFHQKTNIHIGFAISLRTGGVVVPTLHDVDKKSLDQLMSTLSDVIVRSRSSRLRSSELTDSTITMTNLGEDGVDGVFGIIYPPQVALIGFGGIRERPWASNGMIGVRPVLTISLSADHRATDGATGSRFLKSIEKYLLHPGLL